MKKIGILCAGDRELDAFLSHIENVTVIQKAMLNFHKGQIKGIDTVAVYSGVCKVNAAIVPKY